MQEIHKCFKCGKKFGIVTTVDVDIPHLCPDCKKSQFSLRTNGVTLIKVKCAYCKMPIYSNIRKNLHYCSKACSRKQRNLKIQYGRKNLNWNSRAKLGSYRRMTEKSIKNKTVEKVKKSLVQALIRIELCENELKKRGVKIE